MSQYLLPSLTYSATSLSPSLSIVFIAPTDHVAVKLSIFVIFSPSTLAFMKSSLISSPLISPKFSPLRNSALPLSHPMCVGLYFCSSPSAQAERLCETETKTL